jgi:hypothetical protein
MRKNVVSDWMQRGAALDSTNLEIFGVDRLAGLLKLDAKFSGRETARRFRGRRSNQAG